MTGDGVPDFMTVLDGLSVWLADRVELRLATTSRLSEMKIGATQTEGQLMMRKEI